MHRIFTIQGIVDEILSKMSPSQLATMVCVNHFWFFSSLPFLWREVKLSNALGVLGELSEMLPNGYSFVKLHLLSPAQCQRFLDYCKNVRIVVGCEYDIRILATAASFQPDNIPYLFPNLRSLTWRCKDGKFLVEKFPVTDIPSLISPSLETFSMDLRDIPLPFFRSVCYVLIIRVRALRTLQICMDSRNSMQLEDPVGCVHPFGLVLQSFKKTLEHVTMPEIFHTEEIVEKLGQLPNLRELVIGPTQETESNHYPLMIMRKKEGDFGCLDSLSFNGSQRALCSIFLGKKTFSSLTKIFWKRCMEIVDPESFATTIVGACPQLYTLVVGDPDAYKQKVDLPPIIPWETIRILLDCQGLSRLSLHCCRVAMAPEDWIELLSINFSDTYQWQDIHIYSVVPLRLSDLPIFVRYCPSLRSLGIHVDVRSIGDAGPGDTSLPPSIISPSVAHTFTQPGPYGDHFDQFICLYDVNFGYSPYYPHLGSEIASFILGTCSTIADSPILTVPLSINGWDWPRKEFKYNGDTISSFWANVMHVM